MVLYNAATRELTAKIVYYGPGLGGKTTNLQLLHDRLDQGSVGKLLTLSTQTDRTISFDMLPVDLGEIKGYKIRFQLATVPGQTAYNETRRVVLRGTDGIVFVADSRWSMLPNNEESWQNLKDNLMEIGLSFETIPIVIQYNKRDLSDILSVEGMQEALGLSSYPFAEAVASAGRGVTETFKLISKLTFVDLLRRLQGRKPEEATLWAGRTARAEAAEAPGPLEAVGVADTESPGARPEAAAPEPEPGAEEERLSGFEARLSAIAADLARQAEEQDRQRQEITDAAARTEAVERRLEDEADARRTASATHESLSARAENLFQEIAADLARQTQEQARLGQEVTDAAARMEAVERRLDEEAGARQAAERTASATHENLSARAENLFQEIAAVLRRVEDLESSLQERTSQGRREGEDIRAQIAALLEQREERRASDLLALAELERLRESLADSLAEIADRLRTAIREL